jgi:RNA polymerase sigma-70 factor, ECF subfamily
MYRSARMSQIQKGFAMQPLPFHRSTHVIGETTEKQASIEFHSALVNSIPHLRAFARSLAGTRDRADDLVQDAMVRALGAAHQFSPGTNFKAWIFTILRNLPFGEFRSNRLPFRPLEEADMETHTTPPTQLAGLEFDDFRRTFDTLPSEQREALVLVGAEGFSYGEAADICGCPLGTLKSRISRARQELTKLSLDTGGQPRRIAFETSPTAGGVRGATPLG